MNTLIFAERNIKEIIRDPVTVFFGICFPIILLLLLTLIQSNVPVELFSINKLAPGIAVFGLSFIALFSGTLVAKDRTSAFLMRLYSSPMKPYQFILGYAIPFIPLSLVQSAVCFAVAVLLGLPLDFNIVVGIASVIPAALFYTGIGILCGCAFSDKQVGGICGALLTNVSAWLSGIWFDISLMGKTLESVANCLPFANAVRLAQSVFCDELTCSAKTFIIVMAYATVALLAAAVLFSAKMKSDNK